MPVKFNGMDKVQRKFAQLAADFHSLPSDKSQNPLGIWETGYGDRGTESARPTVAKAGQYRGNRWPGLKIQYKRKTDGVVVPVWGGVPRAVFGKHARSQLGVVTRATGTGIRKGLSKQDRALGHGIVHKGQLIGRGGSVLGRLKSDGGRYNRSDKQMGNVQGRIGLLQSWYAPTGKLDQNGKRLTKITNEPHAAKVAVKRPFHWGRGIANLERFELERVAGKWLSARLRKSA